MTDHKFEPFQQVLVRDTDAQNWTGLLYSHKIGDIHMCGDMSWKQCIPYTPETEHLLGTSQPYEPPKPPQEYEWGQKVEVYSCGEWDRAIFFAKVSDDNARCMFYGGTVTVDVKIDDIRPLTDTAAQ